MRYPSFPILAFCLLAPALLAVAPHPTVLTVKYKDQLLPVVRVKGTEPFVMVDGKEVRIRSNPVYFSQDAARFSENFVTAPKRPLAGTMKLVKPGEHSENLDLTSALSMLIDFEVELIAKDTLNRGYAMLVMYAPDAFSRHSAHPTQAQSVVHELPDLPAGQSVKFKFFARRVPRAAEALFFVQIYDANGQEVRTNYSAHAWKFYALRDHSRLESSIEKYLATNPGTDHAAEPVSTPRPVFTSTAVLPKGEVVVTLTVEPDGTVSSVDAGMIADDSARRSLTEAMSGWLFLPKLRAGQPVSTQIKVPLNF